MPKSKKAETQEGQSARFRAVVERMIADGELSPTEVDERLERLMRRMNAGKK